MNFIKVQINFKVGKFQVSVGPTMEVLDMVYKYHALFNAEKPTKNTSSKLERC